MREANYSRWQKDLSGAGLNPSEESFQALAEAYGAAERHYHNLRHVQDVLSWVDVLTEKEGLYDPATPLAAWYHDVVYEPLAKNNEEESAAFAVKWMSRLGASDELKARVQEMILSTRDHRPIPGTSSSILCDADLTILAAPPREYRDYTDAVRREYAMVPTRAFNEGRLRVLLHLLDRETLFTTKTMIEQLERAARANLKEEVAVLRTLLEDQA